MNHSQKEALVKLQKYCAYQERCHAEAEARLAEEGLFGEEAGEVLIALTRSGFLDEERFARSFARGKFRLKKWGRVKIRLELRQRKISDYCIQKGLEEIREGEYSQTVHVLAEAKWRSLKGERNVWVKRKKTGSYLLQKGYEPELVNEKLKELAEV